MTATAKQTRRTMQRADWVAFLVILAVTVNVPLVFLLAWLQGVGAWVAGAVCFAASMFAMWLWDRWRSRRTTD